MIDTLNKLKLKHDVGIVSGNDQAKCFELCGKDYSLSLDYLFCENGTVAYKDGKLLEKVSISDTIGDDNLKKIINFCLRHIADIDIPIKRGTFI